MAQTNSSLQRWEPIFVSLLRIVVGLLFLEHGTQKLFHFPPPDHRMGMHGLTPLMTIAASLELVGGLPLVLGLFTRLVSGIGFTSSFIPLPSSFLRAVVLYLAVAGGRLIRPTFHQHRPIFSVLVFQIFSFLIPTPNLTLDHCFQQIRFTFANPTAATQPLR